MPRQTTPPTELKDHASGYQWWYASAHAASVLMAQAAGIAPNHPAMRGRGDSLFVFPIDGRPHLAGVRGDRIAVLPLCYQKTNNNEPDGPAPLEWAFGRFHSIPSGRGGAFGESVKRRPTPGRQPALFVLVPEDPNRPLGLAPGDLIETGGAWPTGPAVEAGAAPGENFAIAPFVRPREREVRNPLTAAVMLTPWALAEMGLVADAADDGARDSHISLWRSGPFVDDRPDPVYWESTGYSGAVRAFGVMSPIKP